MFNAGCSGLLPRSWKTVMGTLVVLLGGVMGIDGQGISFTNFSRISGTDLAPLSSYRFTNVAAGVDAIVTIDAVSPGATLTQLDNSSPPPLVDGFYEYFQPKLSGIASQNHYADFTITFVPTGLSTPTSMGVRNVAVMDIDGNNQEGNTYEFVVVDSFNAFRTESNSYVQAGIQSLDPVQVAFQSGKAGGPPGPQGISFDSDHIAELFFDDLSSFSVRLGLTGTRTTEQTRLYALNMWDVPYSFTDPVLVTVPEPGVLLLVAFGGLLVCRRKRVR